MGVSRSEKTIHERARWTSMCCQENGLTYSRLVVQSDDSFIFISCRCWFNRNFTSNCAELSSHFLTTVDAYTPTERVFALLCLRVSGLSVRCVFFFLCSSWRVFKLVPSRVVFPYSCFTSLPIPSILLKCVLFHYMSYFYMCHMSIFVIWLYRLYIYIYIKMSYQMNPL